MLHILSVRDLALVIQKEKPMRHITFSSVASLVLSYFSTLCHKVHEFRKHFRTLNLCFDFLYNLATFLILRRIERDINIWRSSCKVPVILDMY